ncbi:uncharacterized protein C12orf71 homolog [Urocitellus parryii]
MEDSSSRSNCPDMEHSISKSKYNQSVSVSYFPHEDSIECEDIIPCEELTAEGFSCHFLPPVQEGWGTKSVKRPMGKRNQIQDNPEELGEEAIIEVLDAYLGCHHEDSGANALSEDNQRMDQCPKRRTNQTLWDLDDLMKNLQAFLDNEKDDKDDDTVVSDSQDEDLQLSNRISPHMDQVSHQEHEACQDLPPCCPPEERDMDQFLEMPLGLEDDEIVEVSTELPHCRARHGPSGGCQVGQHGVPAPAVKQRWTPVSAQICNRRRMTVKKGAEPGTRCGENAKEQ